MKQSKIFLIGSPHHGNLGDSAIAYSESIFIKDIFKNSTLYIISQENAINCFDSIKSYITDETILFLTGGGNMGVDYFLAEEIRRKYIENFPNNKIIIFPQTIDYGNSEIGLSELENSIKIYSKHTNLTLIAREVPSYNLMKKIYPKSTVILTPDIVTYLDKSFPKITRKGVLLSLRKDREKVFSNKDFDKLIFLCNKKFKNIKYKDTVLKHIIPESKKLYFLDEIWNEFKSSELVITDRLHGMIFCAITSTPCIAMRNYNPVCQLEKQLLISLCSSVKKNSPLQETDQSET